MTCVITVVSPEATEKLDLIHRELSVPLSVTFHGRGTADRSVLELLGIDSNEPSNAYHQSYIRWT